MSSRNLIITFEENSSLISFSGDTYSYREDIKSLRGAKWQFESKTWCVPLAENSIDSLKKRFPLANFINFNNINSTIEVFTNETENISNLTEPSDSLSVSSLIFSIDSVIRRYFANEQKIFGILRGIKNFKQTRIYFDLHDPEKNDVSIRCVIWESHLAPILALADQGFKLEEDLPVLLSANLAMNSKNASCSLQVKKFYPEYTKGKIAAEREKTNNKLKTEGVFSLNKQIKVPIIPKNIAVLTSKTGTVINDFLSSLSVANFGFNVSWFPVRVQGQDAKNDIIKAITYFNNDPNIDLILLFRGGGSSADLSIFNSYEVAKAVCLSKKPIYSAVGHEEDQSSTQDVSNKSFGVPKDIGHYLSRIILDYRQEVIKLSEKLLLATQNSTLETETRIKNIVSMLLNIVGYHVEKISDKLKSVSVFFNLGILLVRKEEKELHSVSENLFRNSYLILDRFSEKLMNSNSIHKVSEIIINNFDQTVERFRQFFLAISPEVQIARGFAIISHKGKIISSGKNLKKDDIIEVSLNDVVLYCNNRNKN